MTSPETPIEVHPPECLLRHEPPVFVGIEPSREQDLQRHNNDLHKKPTSTSQVDDMINSMLPPREWVEESGAWMQYVSKDPATRLDVIRLQEELDQKLAERQARETGICAVREHLYQQGFDELIRQITLDGPERGLLLLRVRDEVRMTIEALKTLYNSSVVYGIRKQLQAAQSMDEMDATIVNLEADKKVLEAKVAELRSKVEMIEKREAEKKALDDKKRKEELDFLKYQGQHLDAFMKQISGSK